MPNSLQPQGLYSPWNSLGPNTGVGSLSLLKRIFPTQGSNPGLPHYRQILYQLSHQGSPVLPDIWSNGTSLRKCSMNTSGLLYDLFQVFISPCIFISYYLRKMVSEKLFLLPLKLYHKIFALFSLY